MVRKPNSKNNLRPILSHLQFYIYIYIFLKYGELRLFSHEKAFLKVEIVYFWLKNENIIKKNKKLLHLSGPCPQTT
jgi:hypothetical protein